MNTFGTIGGNLQAGETLSGSLTGSGTLSGSLAKALEHPPTYEGAYIWTPQETAQVAETSGLLMAQDLTIEPIPENYYDMSGAMSFLGLECEKVEEDYRDEWTLAETNFATWTPSTTAATILAYGNVGTFVADLENYEYFLRWRVDADIKYTGATPHAATERQTFSIWQNIHRRPYGLANIAAEIDSYNYCTAHFTASSYILYKNASGTDTWTTGISYGIYASAQAAALSSTSSFHPTVTRRHPPILARCSTTYFSTAAAAQVDKDASTVKIFGDVYRVKRGTSQTRIFYRDAIDILNNGI